MSDAVADLPAWGPWSPADMPPAERKAQLRQIATLVHVVWPSARLLVQFLREAEDIDPASLDRARRLFDALPTLVQRRIIATMAMVTKIGGGDIGNKTVVDER